MLYYDLEDLPEDYKLTTTKQRFSIIIKLKCLWNIRVACEETLAGNKSETVNLGKEKKQTPKQQLKDAKTALLKKDYELKMKYWKLFFLTKVGFNLIIQYSEVSLIRGFFFIRAHSLNLLLIYATNNKWQSIKFIAKKNALNDIHW